MINTKLPRCPYDGDRGEHDFEMDMTGGLVEIFCRECGGFLCKEQPASSVVVSGLRVSTRLSSSQCMVFAT